MFDQDIELRGKHATFTKELVNGWQVLRRNIDVYMLGAIVGLLSDRRTEEDRTSDDSTAILAAQFIRERTKCEFIYQLVLLLSDDTKLTPEERVDRAFRVNDENPTALAENMLIFDAFVRGGIEVLHERFHDCTTDVDYETRMVEMAHEFQQNSFGAPYDEQIAKLINV